MNEKQILTLKKELNIELNENQTQIFETYEKLFLEKNSRTNLISKNDEKFLFEKHIFDSLAINLFLKPKKKMTLLDIGTGGGFPAIPISILYTDLEVFALDSIKKKINLIEEIKTDLNLKNLFPVCDRVENISQQFNYITTRAVAPIKIILNYAVPKLKENGYFIAYKSQKASEELKEAEKLIKKSSLELLDIIEYRLPLEENYKRNLIVFKKTK